MDPEQHLLKDLARAKQQRRDVEAELERQRRVLADLQAEVIMHRLRGRLLRLEDFDLHIGVANVITPEGRVDGRRLEMLLADLLRRRPELGVNPGEGAGQRVESG